jgi:hypothetical protein
MMSPSTPPDDHRAATEVPRNSGHPLLAAPLRQHTKALAELEKKLEDHIEAMRRLEVKLPDQ